jgi:hypothetical protein
MPDRCLPRLCSLALALASLGFLASPAAGQSVLQQNDIAVATSNGVYLLHFKQAAVRVVPGPLVAPAIEWEPDSDRFYLATGNQLLRVAVQTFATGGATLQTLATLPAGSELVDLDIDHSTGDVWVLDQKKNQALRFMAPVSPGASPDLIVQLAERTRSLSVDSVNQPLSLMYMVTLGLMRQHIDGPPVMEISHPIGTSDTATDVSWQHARWGTFFVNTDSHGIYLAPFGGAQGAFALQSPADAFVAHPTDLEWLPNSGKLYAVTVDGVRLSSFPTLQTNGAGVHVVEIRPGGGAPMSGVPIAQLVSHPSGLTGIYGTEADISIVLDGSFAGPYGNPSPALSGEAPLMEAVSFPLLGNAAFGMNIVGGPPGRPVFVGIGLAPANLIVGGGVQLIAPRVWMSMGPTDSLGDLLLPAPVPNNPGFAAMDLFVQGVVFGSDLEPAFTNALRVRFR